MLLCWIHTLFLCGFHNWKRTKPINLFIVLYCPFALFSNVNSIQIVGAHPFLNPNITSILYYIRLQNPAFFPFLNWFFWKLFLLFTNWVILIKISWCFNRLFIIVIRLEGNFCCEFFLIFKVFSQSGVAYIVALLCLCPLWWLFSRHAWQGWCLGFQAISSWAPFCWILIFLLIPLLFLLCWIIKALFRNARLFIARLFFFTILYFLHCWRFSLVHRVWNLKFITIHFCKIFSNLYE